MLVYLLTITLVIPNWNMGSVSAIDMYHNFGLEVYDKDNVSNSNSKQLIDEYYPDLIDNVKRSNEFSDIENRGRLVDPVEQDIINSIELKGISLTTQRQYLMGWKSILDEPGSKMMMIEADKEISFSNKINYKLSADNSYAKDNPIIIDFTLENLSNKDLWVLNWYTPLEGLKGKIFTVICDGKEIPYEGIMMKRGQPTKEDYIHINPEGSVSAEVDLSDAYKLPVSKVCLVDLTKHRIYDFSTDGNSIPKRTEEHQMLNITGNTVTFSVVNS